MCFFPEPFRFSPFARRAIRTPLLLPRAPPVSCVLSARPKTNTLASGWCRFTSALNRVFTSCAEASASRPSASSALRSALRTVGTLTAAAPRPAARRLLRRVPGRCRMDHRHRRIRDEGGRNGSATSAVRRSSPSSRSDMADDGFLLIPENVLGVHAGEEIVRIVVFAGMIEAKPPIFALAQPPPWARDGSRAPCNSATRRPGIGCAADDLCRA
jgi:hypothetical protein